MRRHRGQEAHRPLGRADDPRVRGRPARLERRRRRQGDRDLPRAQGGADRDRRRRRRRASRRRGRDDLRFRSCIPISRSCCARWRATCSATRPRSRSTRRRARCARRAAASRRARRLATRRRRPARARSRSSSSRSPTRFFDGLRTGDYDGALEAGTAVRLASLLRYATGVVPLDAYQIEFGKVGTPSTVVEDLTAALTKAIEELTRPIDAIKHQAKTVTVGISRSDETLLQVPLVQEVLATGAPRDSLTYRALRTLVALDPAVDAVVGWTRYRIDGDPSRGRDDPRDRPRRHRARHPVAHRRQPDAARYQAPRRERARGHGGARPRRRPHADRSCPRSRATRRPASRCCTCGSTIGCPADAARRVLEGYRDRYRGHRRPGHRDRAGDARRRARRRSTSSSCSPSRSCGSPTVGGP